MLCQGPTRLLLGGPSVPHLWPGTGGPSSGAGCKTSPMEEGEEERRHHGSLLVAQVENNHFNARCKAIICLRCDACDGLVMINDPRSLIIGFLPLFFFLPFDPSINVCK